MKKIIVILLITVISFAAFNSCNDPTFYAVSRDVKIKPPFITGSPSNFVVFNSAMYVASGKYIYSYQIPNNSTAASWKRETKAPGGDVAHLAVSSGYVYAVCQTGSSTGILKRTADPSGSSGWTQLSNLNNYNIQSIYAVGADLFFSTIDSAGSVGSVVKYKIFKSTDSDINTTVTDITGSNTVGFLYGVAASGGDTFLCAGSIYKYSAGSLTSVSGSTNNFISIIDIGSAADNILAITRTGLLNKVTSSGISELAKTNKTVTTAITTWVDPTNTYKLLLVGVQDISYSTSTGFSYGYYEIGYNDATGISSGTAFKKPGEAPSSSTIKDNSTYINTIGANPVNHIIQTPSIVDSSGRLFASTQAKGVWRLINDQWNTQE